MHCFRSSSQTLGSASTASRRSLPCGCRSPRRHPTLDVERVVRARPPALAWERRTGWRCEQRGRGSRNSGCLFLTGTKPGLSSHMELTPHASHVNSLSNPLPPPLFAVSLSPSCMHAASSPQPCCKSAFEKTTLVPRPPSAVSHAPRVPLGGAGWRLCARAERCEHMRAAQSAHHITTSATE